MANNRTNVETKDQEHVPFTISVETPAPFKSNTECWYTSTNELAEVIAGLFGPIFGDYCGTKVNFNIGGDIGYISRNVPMGAPYVDIYLKDRGTPKNGKIKNLIAIGGPSSDKTDRNILARYNNTLNVANRRVYELSEDTRTALDEFIPRVGKKINWNELTMEMTNNINSLTSRGEVVVRITGLSLTKILAKIFGEKDEDGYFEYRVDMIRANTTNTDHIIMISRMNSSTINEVANLLGTNPNPSLNYRAYNG